MRIGGEGGEVTAHKSIVPFISCSMHVQLTRLLKSPHTKNKTKHKQPNKQKKKTTHQTPRKNKKIKTATKTKDFLREREGLIYFSKCKCMSLALQTRALACRDSWFCLISVGTTTLCHTLTD